MNLKRLNRCEVALKSTSPPANLIPIELRMQKRWITSKRRNSKSGQQKQNESLEVAYFNILLKAKKLWSGSDELAFERDYRSDNTESAFLMYAFMTDSCYLLLECEFDFVYSLDYAFHNCKFEAQLRDLITPILTLYRVKEVNLNPDFAGFYNNVLAYQQARFQYHL